MSDKNAYEKKFEAQVDECRAEIEKLHVKAEQAGADARVKHKKQIDELRVMQDDALSKLEQLRSAREDAWLDLKSGVDNSWESLNKALKLAASRFK